MYLVKAARLLDCLPFLYVHGEQKDHIYHHGQTVSFVCSYVGANRYRRNLSEGGEGRIRGEEERGREKRREKRGEGEERGKRGRGEEKMRQEGRGAWG